VHPGDAMGSEPKSTLRRSGGIGAPGRWRSRRRLGQSTSVETETLRDDDELTPWSTVEQLVHTMRIPPGDSADVVSRICAEATRIVPVVQHAGVIVVGPDRKLQTVFASGPVPRSLDELQMRTNTGPCLTAARKQIVVRMHDIAADTRWAEFRDAALGCDVASMLCVPLFVDEHVLGTLSLYGERPGVFREGAEPMARMLATLSAVALADDQKRQRMERALANRDLIGQAKGVLMVRQGIRADEAFAMLREHSQRTNSKLLRVAAQVVETGGLE
jgi:GAF domain-containing protein